MQPTEQLSEFRPRHHLAEELRAWLGLVDSVLVAIERIAWEVRGVADSALEAWECGVAAQQAAHDRAEQLARLRKTGWMLTQVAAGYRLFGLRAAFVSRRHAEIEQGRRTKRRVRGPRPLLRPEIRKQVHRGGVSPGREQLDGRLEADLRGRRRDRSVRLLRRGRIHGSAQERRGLLQQRGGAQM